MSTESPNYVKWFRQSSPYINAYRGKTFVIMLPGEAVEHSNFSNIIHDIALLNSLGIQLVIVHGARAQINHHLASVGITSAFHNNLRITSQQCINPIAQAIGEVRFSIEASLSTGLPNSPMHGSHIRVVGGNFITAKPYGVVDGVDLQHTGLSRRVDSQGLSHALNQGAVALLSPLGFSPTGEMFNLSFTDVGTQVAIGLQADKLIAFSAEQGARDAEGQLLRELTVEECKSLLSSTTHHSDSDIYSTLQSCLEVCAHSVPRAQIVSYTEDGALIRELFTRDGMGTMVYSDSYEVIRRARIDDVGGIIELIDPLEKQGVLVHRSRERLETEVNHFTIMEKDGMVIACIALYPFPEYKSAELACVVTHEDYRNEGHAAKLLLHIEKQARKLKLNKLFTLTTQAAHWFLQQGFVQGDLDALPERKQTLYNYRRNSKVFVKSLGSE